MHSYSTKENKIEKIVFWLAIASYLLAPYLASNLMNLINMNAQVTAFMNNIGLSITSIFLFGILYLIFISWIWKIPFISKWLKVADISGTWICKGIGRKYDDLSICNEWMATVKIVQTLTKIEITLITDNSRSRSTSVISNIELHETNECTLSYMYFNKPYDSEEGLNEHEGFCSLVFDLRNKTAKGAYYTNPARKSYGSMELEKK